MIVRPWNYRLPRALVALLLLYALTACSQQTTEPQATATVPQPKPSPFESVVESEPFTSPIPTPAAKAPPASEQDLPLLDRDPTPEPGKATVQGMLTLNGQPAAGRTLYLAPVIHTGQDGGGSVAALDAANDPRAESDRSGYFGFTNVPPGQYALGINSPVGPVLIRNRDKEIIAEAEADQIVDLGTIKIVPFN